MSLASAPTASHATPQDAIDDFDYAAPSNQLAVAELNLSIYADRPHIRDEMCEDGLAAGMRIAHCGDLDDLLNGNVQALGEMIVMDCPQAYAPHLAALARLDMRAAHCGATMIVSTTMPALDAIFGCLDQSDPQILVDPSRGERVLAMGQAMARLANRSLHELSEQDRLTLLRMTEHLAQISRRIERLEKPAVEPVFDPVFGLADGDNEGSVFRFETPKRPFNGQNPDAEDRLIRPAKPPLPDPRLIRRMLRQRQLRARFFDGELFADPAWDMLLDLTAARAEHKRVSITSLCIASGVPPTTALRWIGQMVDTGLFNRIEDDTDRRRAFIALSDRAAEAMARLFIEIGNDAKRLI